MTKQEKIKIVTKLISQYKKLDSSFDSFYKLCGADHESELGRAVWGMFDSYILNVEKRLGYDYNEISWFIYDNDCGKRNYEYDGVKIKNIKQLINVLEKKNNDPAN